MTKWSCPICRAVLPAPQTAVCPACGASPVEDPGAPVLKDAAFREAMEEYRRERERIRLPDRPRLAWRWFIPAAVFLFYIWPALLLDAPLLAVLCGALSLGLAAHPLRDYSRNMSEYRLEMQKAEDGLEAYRDSVMAERDSRRAGMPLYSTRFVCPRCGHAASAQPDGEGYRCRNCGYIW